MGKTAAMDISLDWLAATVRVQPGKQTWERGDDEGDEADERWDRGM